MSDVLVFTPTYADLMRQEMIDSLHAQRSFVSWDWVVSEDNPWPGRDMRNVNHQYIRAQKMALDGGYEALLTLEHDMVMPAECIQTLWDTPAPVVYSAYMLRHGTEVLSLFKKQGVKNVGMSLSIFPRDLRAFHRQGYGEVSGVGWGCTLIRRQVLEKIPFRQTEKHANDIPFAVDCLRAGVLQMGRTDVACGHINEEGVLLDPHMDGGIAARVRALTTVTVSVEGQPLPMVKNAYYTMRLADAREHQRAGYVEISNEADEVADDMGISARETAEAPVTKRKPKPRRRTRKPKNAAGDTD